MPMSTAAYEAASFADEGGAAVAYGSCLPAHAENEKGNNDESSIQSSKQSKTTTSKKEKRFSLLRRLSSSKLTKSGTNQHKGQHKSSFGQRRLRPESSAPARWPARRRSSIQSDMSGQTWLTSGTENRSSRALGGGGGQADMHKKSQNTGKAEAEEEVAREPFQNSLLGDDLSEVLMRGLGVRRDDSRRQLLLNSTPGSQHANDGSHDTSSDDMDMYRTAHGGNEDCDNDIDIDINGSFLSCIAEPSSEIAPAPQDQASASESEQQVEQRPPSPPAVHHPRRRKSVEFQDVVSYATVADKRALSNDELNALFYSVSGHFGSRVLIYLIHRDTYESHVLLYFSQTPTQPTGRRGGPPPARAEIRDPRRQGQSLSIPNAPQLLSQGRRAVLPQPQGSSKPPGRSAEHHRRRPRRAARPDGQTGPSLRRRGDRHRLHPGQPGRATRCPGTGRERRDRCYPHSGRGLWQKRRNEVQNGRRHPDQPIDPQRVYTRGSASPRLQPRGCSLCVGHRRDHADS